MPDSLLVQLNCCAMLTEQMGIATRAQYSRHVPNNSTTVHVRARGLKRMLEVDWHLNYQLICNCSFICSTLVFFSFRTTSYKVAFKTLNASHESENKNMSQSHTTSPFLQHQVILLSMALLWCDLATIKSRNAKTPTIHIWIIQLVRTA